ncbi:hypothetical protein D3C71_1610690 [compost metagenome]
MLKLNAALGARIEPLIFTPETLSVVALGKLYITFSPVVPFVKPKALLKLTVFPKIV